MNNGLKETFSNRTTNTIKNLQRPQECKNIVQNFFKELQPVNGGSYDGSEDDLSPLL